MDDKDKIIAKEAGKVVVEGALAAADAIVIGGLPVLSTTWKLCQALLGASLQIRQQRALEWVEMIRDNPTTFGIAILESEDFQDGFVIGLEQYLKMRNEEKRQLARLIFLGFASSEDRERFKLEKLYNTLSLITVDGLEYLAFLNETIIPRMVAHIESEAERISKQNGGGDTERDWWIKAGWRTETVWGHFDKWLYEEFDPNSPKVKERYHYNKEADRYDDDTQVIFDIEEGHRTRGREMMAEYVSLGLFRVGVKSTVAIGGGGASVEFTLTDYGKEFLSFVDGYKIFSSKLESLVTTPERID